MAFLSEFTRCFSDKLLEELGEIGRVVRQYPCNFGNGFIGFQKHFLCLVDDSEVVEMTGVIPGFLLYGVGQVFVGYEQFTCYLADLHEISRSSGNDIGNVSV